MSFHDEQESRMPEPDELLVIDVHATEEKVGPQGQRLRAALTNDTVPGTVFSWLEVSMPEGSEGISIPHVHEHSVIAVRMRDHLGVTLAGPDLDHFVLHGPGEIVQVPAGLLHCAVNPYPVHKPDRGVSVGIIADEIRSDPAGNADVTPRHDLDRLAAARASQVRALLAFQQHTPRTQWKTRGVLPPVEDTTFPWEHPGGFTETEWYRRGRTVIEAAQAAGMQTQWIVPAHMKAPGLHHLEGIPVFSGMVETPCVLTKTLRKP